ncbi:MAG: hypothetical protein WCO78_01360 [Candidatus Roizmanbacteria bacterium]
MKVYSNFQKGFIALTSVLIVSVVVLSITITVIYLSIGQGQSALATYKGEEQLTFVEGCMEDALLKIKANAGYSGGSITRPEGTCTITVSQAVNVYTVTATGITTLYKRTIQTIATRGSNIIITSWKEI